MDITALLGKLDTVEGKINDFVKSAAGEREARTAGETKVTGEIDAMRRQLQEFAQLVKGGIPAARKSISRMWGELVFAQYHKKAMTETTTGGGYLVNEELRTDLLSVQQQYGAVRQLMGAAIWPMKSNVMKVPVDTFEDTSGNTPEPASKAINTQITPSTDPVLDQASLTAVAYATLNYIPEELIDDSFLDIIGAFLVPKIARRKAKIEDQIVFTTASTGLLKTTSGPQIVNMAATKDAFGDLAIADLLEMQDAVVSDSANTGRYMLNRSILSLIRGMKDNNGRPLIEPALAGEPPTILGQPYSKVEIMPKQSDSNPSTGFIMFGDLAKGCVVGDAGGEKIDSSREFRFDYAQVALRMIFRFAYTSNANLGRALSVLKTAAA